MKNCRNRQFVSFKLHTVLSIITKSCTILIYNAWTRPIPLSSISNCVYSLPWQSLGSHLSHQINYCSITVLTFKSPLFYLIIVLKYKSNDVAILLLLSLFLLIIVFNILLCLLYKLNFIRGMNVEEEHSICRVQYYPQSQVSTGGLGSIP